MAIKVLLRHCQQRFKHRSHNRPRWQMSLRAWVIRDRATSTSTLRCQLRNLLWSILPYPTATKKVSSSRTSDSIARCLWRTTFKLRPRTSSRRLHSDDVSRRRLRPQTPQSRKRKQSPPKPISTMDGAGDSSDEFPELFSQAFEARMSQEPLIKNESSQKYEMYKVAKAKDRLSSSQKSNINTSRNSSFRPSQPQVQQSSQIMDLAILSDPLEPIDDENEADSRYRSSSGWVDKPRANRSIGVTKKPSRRSTRSRS